MGKQVFIPLTDDILYEHPEFINGPLRPYATGMPCYHWLSVELNPREDMPGHASARSAKFSRLFTAFRLPTLDKASRGEAPSLLSP